MGDEGKGRLIPEMAAELRQSTGDPACLAAVAKINGGANSGHTVAGLKLNLFPAGAADPQVPRLGIGAGVVADPRKFHWEAAYIQTEGHEALSRLLIDERAQVSDLGHRLLDFAWEDYRVNILGEPRRGTTGRGITPAFADEVSQWPVHYGEFKTGGKDAFVRKFLPRLERALDVIQYVCKVTPEAWESFFDKLTEAETRANAGTIEAGALPEEEFDFRRFKGREPFTLDMDAVVETYWRAGAALADRIGSLREEILAAMSGGKYVIAEFGQSFWLDKRQGFPPNVTASHTYVPEMFSSLGIPFQPAHVVGVSKAYDTKVGTHVFLTQMPDTHPLAEKLKKLEYGTATGRQRMVGWCDAVEKGDALRYGGFHDLMINKLDALTYSGDWQGGELLICTGYRDKRGATHCGVPRMDAERKELQPVYIQLPGWSEDISQVRRFADLPGNAKRYIAVMVRSILDVACRDGFRPAEPPNLRYVGVGPDPSQIIKDVPSAEGLLKLAGP